MTSQVDAAAIRAALDAATPGPWQREGESDWASSNGELWFGEAGTRADAELIVLLRNNAEALLDALADAERRGAVKALRRVQSEAFNKWSVKPYVDEWLRARADAIEDGAEL